MKKAKKLTSIVLALLMVLSVIVAVPMTAGAADVSIFATGTQSMSGNFNTSYTVTGNGATDMVNIAKAQNNRNQTSMGYTENWCADFVSDCAKLAGQSSAIPFNGVVNSLYTAVINAGGTRVSTAQAGDLVFFSNGSGYGHVGIATDSSHNISGNIFYLGASPSKVCILQNDQEGFNSWVYVRPNYSNTSPNPTNPPTGTKTISDGDYLIATAINNRESCISIASNSTADNANVHLWNNVSDSNTCAVVHVTYLGDGYYSLVFKHSGKALDVHDYGTSNGTNVLQYHQTSNDNQKWVIKEAGDGYNYNIISKCNGLYLDVADANSDNGTNIQMWSGNNSNAQKWRFIASGVSLDKHISTGKYYITSALSDTLALDASDAGANQANVRVMNKALRDRAIFYVKNLGYGVYNIEYYRSDRRMDLYNNNPYKGTNVQIYDKNTSNAQQWIIKFVSGGFYSIISKSSGQYLDIDNGSTSDNTNVRIWTNNSTNAQKWRFVPVDETETGEFQNHKYDYFECRSTFAQAYKHCEQLGGHLVTITSQEENDFLKELAKDYTGRAWIGATTYGTSSWNLITGETFDYVNWKPGEPSSSEETGMDMYVSGDYAGQFNDEALDNGNVEGYICEYDNEVNSSNYTPSNTFDYNNHTYELFEEEVDWQTAKKICEDKGGHLALIENQAENNAITEAMQSFNRTEVWIGYTDIKFEGRWKDINDETPSYTNWVSGNPDNDYGIEDYALLNKDGYWRDLKGFSFINRSIGFICEYDEIKTEPEDTKILGDANGNGKIDAQDVLFIRRYNAELSVPATFDSDAADVNRNGKVDAQDVLYMRRYNAELSIPATIKMGQTIS